MTTSKTLGKRSWDYRKKELGHKADSLCNFIAILLTILTLGPLTEKLNSTGQWPEESYMHTTSFSWASGDGTRAAELPEGSLSWRDTPLEGTMQGNAPLIW